MVDVSLCDAPATGLYVEEEQGKTMKVSHPK